MFKLNPQEPPPPDYYATNLRHLFGHVQDFYADLLSAEEAEYLQAFLCASSDAQRLYARLLGRKGPWIRASKLNYREIADLDRAIEELTGIGMLTINEPAPGDALLGMLTQAERRTAFPTIAPARKADWILACIGRYPDEQIRQVLGEHHRWVCLHRYHLVRQLQLLFFGDDHQDTSTFVLQDLGLMRFEAYELTIDQRLFPNRLALDRYRHLRALHGLSHRLHEHSELAEWLGNALPMSVSSRQEQRQRDRTLNRLGQHHERTGDFDRALDCYGRSRMHPSRERRARILKKLDDVVGVEQLLAKMAATPRCSEEIDFANRFGQQAPRAAKAARAAKGARAAKAARAAKGARAAHEVVEIPLTETPSVNIEAHAASLLAANGAEVFHLENSLPRGVAGLAYWDLIFDKHPGAFANPFQTGPLDLFWPDFAISRADTLAKRTSELSAPGAIKRALEETFADKFGVANRMVSWRNFDERVLAALLRFLPEQALLDLATHVIGRPYRTRTGFPDLTVIYGPGNFEFVEVKGPTDQLQPGQRVWLTSLAEMGIPARVMKFKAC